MIGPLQESTSWQAQAGEGYGLYDFEVDWQHQRVRCPQGHLSQRWAPFLDRHGTEKIEVRFSPKMCQACVAREHCTTGARMTYSQTATARSVSGVREAAGGATHVCFQGGIRAPCWCRRNDLTSGTSDENATRVPIVESGRRICIMYRLRLGSMCCGSSPLFMHTCKGNFRVLNVEPRLLLVSKRWLDQFVQMSEQNFPTESSMTRAFSPRSL